MDRHAPRYVRAGLQAAARALYCAGHRQNAIAAQLGVAEKTVSAWKKAGQWAALRRQRAAVAAVRAQVVAALNAAAGAPPAGA